jgi:hypothetical protein
MTPIVILNAVGAAFVITAILVLLGTGIVKDRAMPGKLGTRRLHGRRRRATRAYGSRPITVDG